MNEKGKKAKEELAKLFNELAKSTITTMVLSVVASVFISDKPYTIYTILSILLGCTLGFIFAFVAYKILKNE